MCPLFLVNPLGNPFSPLLNMPSNSLRYLHCATRTLTEILLAAADPRLSFSGLTLHQEWTYVKLDDGHVVDAEVSGRHRTLTVTRLEEHRAGSCVYCI